MNAQSEWQNLITAALVGTERRPITPGGGPVATLLASVEHTTPEQALLHAAAALAQYRRAGFSPTTDSRPLPEAAAPEKLGACSPRAARQLGMLLGGHYRDLLPEWLELAAHYRRYTPPLHLPTLLELGRTQQAMRERILAVLGERGRWLAAQNEDWAYAAALAAEGNTTAWEVADRSTRLTLLHALRAGEPNTARSLIESTWSTEKADDRTAFLSALETGLSMLDEPFLEVALDDRSKEVRRTAAELLARLPTSRLSIRMRERAIQLLTLKRRVLRSALIELRLPAACDSTMQRDGIEIKAHGALGEKAWWLHQMLHAIAPNFWNQTWNIAPADLISIAAQSEWKELLLGAWLGATVRHRDADWAEALLTSSALPVGAELETLVGVLPETRRERFVAKLLRENSPLTPAMLRQCTHMWSESFARAAVGWYRTQASAARQPNWLLLTLVKESARLVPPKLVGEFGLNWPEEAPHWQSWQGAVERFLVVLQFRADMHATLARDD